MGLGFLFPNGGRCGKTWGQTRNCHHDKETAVTGILRGTLSPFVTIPLESTFCRRFWPDCKVWKVTWQDQESPFPEHTVWLLDLIQLMAISVITYQAQSTSKTSTSARRHVGYPPSVPWFNSHRSCWICCSWLCSIFPYPPDLQHCSFSNVWITHLWLLT